MSSFFVFWFSYYLTQSLLISYQFMWFPYQTVQSIPVSWWSHADCAGLIPVSGSVLVWLNWGGSNLVGWPSLGFWSLNWTSPDRVYMVLDGISDHDHHPLWQVALGRQMVSPWHLLMQKNGAEGFSLSGNRTSFTCFISWAPSIFSYSSPPIYIIKIHH